MSAIDVSAVLSRWQQTQGGRATLINLSENHTFRIDAPQGPTVLRLHRPHYQSPAAIQSELAWLAALRRDTALPVPEALPGNDSELVQEVAPGRFAVLFAFDPGREPTADDDLVPLFRTIGGFAAIAHGQAASWQRPAGFIRPTWDAASILDPTGLWGDWRAAPQVAGEIRHALDALDRRLRADLAAYGQGPDRFGLIHADMRLANLLADSGRITLIDFDDSGFGWLLYDLAASLSFLETSPLLPALKQSWIEGYTAIRPLPPSGDAMIDALILLRRMALLAWIGSHGETDLARLHAARFAADTAGLAAAYLR